MKKSIKNGFQDNILIDESITYLLVGIITFLITLVVFYLSIITVLDSADHVQLQIANMISWVVAVIFSFFANRKFVFKSNNDNVLYEAYAFFISRFGTLLVDMLLMYGFVSVIGLDDFFSKLVVQVVVIITNFLVSKFVVFK